MQGPSKAKGVAPAEKEKRDMLNCLLWKIRSMSNQKLALY